MPDCDICFCDIENITYTCCNPDCVCKICDECVKLYIHSIEKGLPKCVVTDCSGEFLFSEVAKCKSRKAVEKYESLCFNFLRNENFDDIINDINQKSLIEKIRKERHEFIIKEYPKAISFIINTCLKVKMKKIAKSNRDHIKSVLGKSNKKCPNILCYSGVLDINFICLACSQKFCKKCEALITETDSLSHICKPEELESINAVKKLIKCPTCKLPVVRSWGCNAITCSNCKTNFDYFTGVKIHAGNHSNATLELKKYEKLSLRMEREKSEDTYMINMIRQIENKEPTKYSFNKILSLLKKYIQIEKENKEELDTLKHTICVKYQKYKLSQYENRKFFKCITRIENEYKTGVITESFLNEINKILK